MGSCWGMAMVGVLSLESATTISSVVLCVSDLLQQWNFNPQLPLASVRFLTARNSFVRLLVPSIGRKVLLSKVYKENQTFSHRL